VILVKRIEKRKKDGEGVYNHFWLVGAEQ